MSVTVTATAGASNANSYLTVAEADVYFNTRLYCSSWTAASAEDKARALIMACRHIEERAEWDESMAGERSTTTQALAWPRSGALTREGDEYLDDATVPSMIKNAQAEQALAELAKNRTGDPSARGLKRVAAGSVEVEFDGYASAEPHVLADEVWDALAPWITNVGSGGPNTLQTVDLLRV
jgi:hypothetical protein